MTHKKGRIWTIEQRQKQAERIRSQKPWLQSTGPKTVAGKRISSRNATRHGCYGTEFKMICLYLRMQKHYSDTLRFMLKHDLFDDETSFENSGNELNENVTKSIQNDTDRHVKAAIKRGVGTRFDSPESKPDDPCHPHNHEYPAHVPQTEQPKRPPIDFQEQKPAKYCPRPTNISLFKYNIMADFTFCKIEKLLLPSSPCLSGESRNPLCPRKIPAFAGMMIKEKTL